MIMIGVSTLYNSRYNSSLYVISYIPRSRYFCTVECSLVQLSADIDFIYQDLTDDIEYSLSRYRLAVIKQQIVAGLYVLSPLHVKFIKRDCLTQFLHEKLPDCPDVMLAICSDDPEIICVVMPDQEDGLVLMGLSLMLLRLSHGNLPKDCYRLESILDSSFYYSLQQMGKVDRLYRLDLKASLSLIPISLILDKVKPFVGEGSVYKLISSFLLLPIIDDDGKNRPDICFGGMMPPVG